MFLDWYGTQMQLGYNTDTRGYEGHMLGDRWVGRSRVRDRLGYYSITPYKLLIDCNMHASHLILLASSRPHAKSSMDMHAVPIIYTRA